MAWLPRDKKTYILLLAGLLFSLPAGAETLVGKVLSIEKETFIVQVELDANMQPQSKELRVRFTPANKGRHRPRHILPRCVRIGWPVRLSGHFNEEENVFLAEDIHGRRHHGGQRHDPTGVRSRLGRCLNKQNKQ